MTRPEAARKMHEIDAQIQQLQAEAMAAGVDPMTSTEYCDLLADWLEAAHAFYCSEESAR